jgi:hypothetical protein
MTQEQGFTELAAPHPAFAGVEKLLTSYGGDKGQRELAY